jgi:hypothetical protein
MRPAGERAGPPRLNGRPRRDDLSNGAAAILAPACDARSSTRAIGLATATARAAAPRLRPAASAARRPRAAARGPARGPRPRAGTWSRRCARARRERHPADGGGRARLVRDPDQAPFTTRASADRFRIVYEVGPLGIATGGSVQLQVSPFWGWSTPQVDDRDAPGLHRDPRRARRHRACARARSTSSCSASR